MKWISINGKAVTFAYRNKVLGIVGDRYQAGLVFYRCIKANPRDYASWIHDGLFGKKKYAYMSCADEYDNIPAVKAWFKENWDGQYRKAPGRISKEIDRIVQRNRPKEENPNQMSLGL